MSNIPKLLLSLSGETITTKEMWEQFRRKEVMHLLSEYVYGVRDIERPDNLFFKQKGETEFCGMRRKDIECGFGSFSFPFSLYLPKAQEGPFPIFVYSLIEGHEDTYHFDGNGNFVHKEHADYCMPAKNITNRGYAVAVMPTRGIYRDWEAHAEFKQGVFAAVKTAKKRQGHAWASISAWAWGMSRVIDYLETDRDIDARHIAAVGHSRGGKTALWAGATDERIELTVSNNSGCMGAAILRGKRGEHAKEINISDWFCENFKAYNDHEEMLPVDQHMLLAAIAPRYLYVTSSSEDAWADPDKEYLACQMASEVYGLYGLQGVVCPNEKPSLDTAYTEGHIAYHNKTGEHSITYYDWDQFMNFFDKIIQNAGLSKTIL